MGRNQSTIDKEDACETQGTVQITSVLVGDPFTTTYPVRIPASNSLRKRLAGLSAPSTSLLSDDVKELWQWTWTGHRYGRIEVDASHWVLLQ